MAGDNRLNKEMSIKFSDQNLNRLKMSEGLEPLSFNKLNETSLKQRNYYVFTKIHT